MDLVGLVNASVDQLKALVPSSVLAVLTIAVGLYLFSRSRFYKRLVAVLEDLLFTNWRLGVLAATGLVLSAASGWTTWDGMRNFTGEPILSAMVTFGIQGVMLIVAWLIGESFATGMNVRSGRTSGSDHGLMWAMGFGFLGIVLVFVGIVGSMTSTQGIAGNYALIAGCAALLIGLFIVAARTDTLGGYADAMRVMIKSGVLWVMFLACMATSVFFSFDSLFSTIFPQEERKRAAELRAQNQVAGVVADIGDLIQRRQLSEAETLFNVDGWKAYDSQMQKLAREAEGAKSEIERYFTNQMEQRRTAIAEQQGRIATSQSSQAALTNKKNALTDEIARLKSERPGYVEDVAQKREVVEAVTKEVDAKRVEVLAEEKGVEGTGKVGRGQMYRQRKAEEDALREKLKIAEERLREPQRRLQQTDQRIVQIERELSTLDGDLAKLKGEAQTAESRIKLAEEGKAADESLAKIDPSRMAPVFEKARQEFRQMPRAEGLLEIQRQCVQLVTAIGSNPATKDRIRGIDCDPKSASEAAARVFALNDGIRNFGAQCQGGDKLVQYKSADALFDFARKCVQESGLASKDTDELRQKINFIELNRDDKANRFVVTWNAFNDGNRLAYLALAIAIAIDSLVFMSGLFGANAVRSPLSDVPTTKARSAEQLESIIDNALLPNRFENARITIEAMHADTSRPGYSAVVELGDLDPERRIVVGKVLNAGATIGAVHRDEHDRTRYFIRPELFEYLSIAGNKAFEQHGKMVKEDIEGKLRLAQLEKDISVALLPDGSAATSRDLNSHIAKGAQIILDHLHPYPFKQDPDFRSELRMDEIETEHRKTARRAMTAAYGLDLVRAAVYKIDNKEVEQEGRYVLHSDLVKTLSRLRARMLLSTSSVAQIAQHSARDGGDLGTSAVPQIASPARPALASPANANQPSPRIVERSEPQPTEAEASPADDLFADHPAEPASATDSALNREFVEHFAREMSQQEGTIEYLMRHAGALDVQRLWTTLDLVIRHDDAGLRQPLLRAMKSVESSVDEARSAFPGKLLTSPGAVTQLNDFADKLKSMTVVMVMLPGAAYDNIINKMEAELEKDAGEGRLSPGDAAKHRLIVRHRSELAKAEYTDDHWEAVLSSLLKLHAGLDQIAADRPPTRMA